MSHETKDKDKDATDKLLGEKLYLFSQIAKMNLFPSRVGARTIRRYAKDGIYSYGGISVFLEYVKTPSGDATSTEACKRFIKNLNTY